MKRLRFLFHLLFTITNTIANTTDTTMIKCPSAIDSLDNCRIYTVVEVPSQFANGWGAFQKYIWKSIDTLNTGGCEYSKIVIEFIIDTLGQVRNACVSLSNYNEHTFCNFQNDLLKAIYKMPLWIPGELSGKKVYTRFTVPIRIHVR
jgi:hypothetical protein